MKKVQTSYMFDNNDESLEIKVNEECDHLDYKPIFIKEAICWRNPEDAIEYYKWVVECIKEITN